MTYTIKKYSMGMIEEDVMAECPVRLTVKLIGGKYKSVILWNLRGGTKRFSEIQSLVPEATGKMITKQLREMEADGLISRKVYPVVPPRTEYSLTELGLTLMPLIEHMCSWGISYMDYHGMRVSDCVRDSFRRSPISSSPADELRDWLADSVVSRRLVRPVADGQDGGDLLGVRQSELLLEDGGVEVPDPHGAQTQLLRGVHHLRRDDGRIDVGEALPVEGSDPRLRRVCDDHEPQGCTVELGRLSEFLEDSGVSATMTLTGCRFLAVGAILPASRMESIASWGTGESVYFLEE